ncbi:MAG: sulfur oxidation c-type cytochrome SoxX [Hyphomicrobiaceae bacterium]|nr:sulfur oxidation c-type cytochrome SoxX [Hyphomicrobiaceae bacterium]
MRLAIIAAIGSLALLSPAAAQTKVDPAKVEAAVASIFGKSPAEWQARIVQDETQKACSETRNQPSPDVAKAIMEREKKNVVFPADGKVIGDWKSGEKLAQSGYGGRHTDDPKRPVGGNCYACHQLSKKELSFGTMGPPLVEYGKVRKYKEEDAKAAYAKIYNAQAVFACSNMPRLGHSKHLNEQQIKDLVALLFDPESPVNK